MILSNVSKLAIVFVIILLMPTVSAIPVMQVDYPFNADAEQPVSIFVNITSDEPIYVTDDESDVKISYIDLNNNNGGGDMKLISGNSKNGTWYFAIPPQTYKGRLNPTIIAKDRSGKSTSYDFIINLEGPEPVKEFPWNIVIIVAFLAVTLVATELIFKPGFYRPTGRQKAAALEEEDRKREQEGIEDMD